MLAGLAALAIPILIHLLMRRRIIRMRFSTIQFFLKKDEKSGRRKKLRQWLLLATRLALLALIVLAFARPFQKSNAPSGKQEQRNIVFVLDRSASMSALEGGVSRWTKAKDLIKKTLDGLTWNDQVALVECAAPSSTLFSFMPPSKLKPELDKLAEGYGAGDLGEALQEATKVLSAKNLSGKLSLYVISDLQRQSCLNIAKTAVPRQIELKVFVVGKTAFPNRAVVDLNLSADGKRSLNMEVADFSPSPAPARLNWAIDGRKQTALSFSAESGGKTNVALPELSPGWHQIEARLEPNDSFSCDNARFLALNIPAPLKTLCVETRDGKHRFEEESFFVNSALDPDSSPGNTLPSMFQIEKIEAAKASAILSDRQRLSQYRLLLLPALRQIPNGAGDALRDFVNQGGAIVFWMGENVDADRYNAEFKGLLPAILRQNEGGALQLENKWHLGDVDFDSAAFSIFRQPGRGDVSLPEFSRRCLLETSTAAEVLARFNDATPFLITKDLGQGRVALVNTSADTAWSDWPKRKTFVPWIHSLCHYLTRTEAVTGLRPEKAFSANAIAEIETDSSRAGKTFRLRLPNGQDTGIAADAQGRFAMRLTNSGVYSVFDTENRLVRLLAANVPSSESDLSALTPSELEQQIVRCDAPLETGLAAELFYSGTGSRDFWRLLMLCAAVLLLFESLLANRTYA